MIIVIVSVCFSFGTMEFINENEQMQWAFCFTVLWKIKNPVWIKIQAANGEILLI